MHSMAGPVEPGSRPADSPNVRVLKDIFTAHDEGGFEAALEGLLGHAHANFEFTPYVGGGRVLKGADEIRAFYRDQLAAGTELSLRPTSFEAHGNEVVVKGSLRIGRPTGGFAETQMSWTFRFRDGLVEEAHWGPRQAA